MKRKPKRYIRASADWSVVGRAVEALTNFEVNPYSDPMSSELGFRYVETPLGVLQVDLGRLLMFITYVLERKRLRPPIELEITEGIARATVEIVRSIPRYVDRDLLGMFFEAQFVSRARRRLGFADHSDNSLTAAKAFARILGTPNHRGSAHLKLLGNVLQVADLSIWSVPEVSEAFLEAVTEGGSVGAGAWHKFLKTHFGSKRQRGRRPEELYDRLFKQRSENPGLSYGTLAREVAKAKNIELTVARDQVKSAIAYRARKSKRRAKVGDAGR